MSKFIIALVFVILFYLVHILQSTESKIIDAIAMNNGTIVELFRSEVHVIGANLYRQRTLDEFGCGNCHNQNNNTLPKGRLTYQSFVCFLENTCRWVNNPNIMPTYKFDEDKLRHIFAEIYD